MRNDLKYLICIWALLIAAIVLTFAHHGHLIFDCGREAYIPTQILAGDLLYRDIFNIYGPLSYLVNAGLFKIFGVHLNSLYGAGIVCAFLIVSLIYFIAKEFLSRFASASIALFGVVIGVMNTNLFNFIFPYSYAMLYGYVGLLVSIFCLIKYINTSKNYLLYLASFFAGFAIANKYEFLPFLVVILFIIFKDKQFKAILFGFIPPILSFGALFLQGLTLADLSANFLILKKMAQSQTLHYFYLTQGTYFSKNTLPMLLKNFVKTILPLGLLFGAVFLNIRTQKSNAKMLSLVGIILSIQVISLWLNPASFAFLPILVSILALVFYKKMNLSTKVLVFSAILLGLKSFFGLATLNYGVFSMLLLIVAFLSFFKENRFVINVLAYYLLIVAMFFTIQSYKGLEFKAEKISTSRGLIYTQKVFAKSSEQLIFYIEKNTNPTDKIVILPEGAMINFLTNRKSDNVYTSLIPLYIEVFGEDKVIEHFKSTKPEYVIFSNVSTADYYFKNICKDYAVEFCNFIAQNYNQKAVIDNEFRYLIFKKQ